jgi:hypothetical protein
VVVAAAGKRNIRGALKSRCINPCLDAGGGRGR